MIKFEIIYGVWCLFWAFANHKAIDSANEKILHAINGLFHFAICLYFAIAVYWQLGIAMLVEGRLVFDVGLNVMRFGWKRIGYVPDNPKSIFDKAEKYVFRGNGVLPKIIYFLILVILNIIILAS